MKAKRRLTGHWKFVFGVGFVAPPGVALGLETGGTFGWVIVTWAALLAVTAFFMVVVAVDSIPMFTETPTYAQLARDVERLETKVEKAEALNQRLTNALVEAPRAVGECARDREK